ncbi:hypothetical protein DMN91_001331, partial [Ooceraea biroi]
CERVLLSAEQLEWSLSPIDRFKEGIGLEWIVGMSIIFVFKPEFVQGKPHLLKVATLDD